MLSFELAKLDHIAIHLDQRGIADLLTALIALQANGSGQMLLEVAKGKCQLNSRTPLGEDGVRTVALHYDAGASDRKTKRTTN